MSEIVHEPLKEAVSFGFTYKLHSNFVLTKRVHFSNILTPSHSSKDIERRKTWFLPSKLWGRAGTWVTTFKILNLIYLQGPIVVENKISSVEEI